jgi:hypothetical protein
MGTRTGIASEKTECTETKAKHRAKWENLTDELSLDGLKGSFDATISNRGNE